MANFSTGIPDCDSPSPALWDFFISSDASICSTKGFPSLKISDHVVVSVSINFLPKLQQDTPFHCIAYDYSHLFIYLFIYLFFYLLIFIQNKNVSIYNMYKKS